MEIHTDIEQGSEQWHALRAGIPTASEFDKLVTGTGKPSTQITGYAATLAAESYAGRPLDRWQGNAATERGHEFEPEARADYEFTNDVEAVQVGFITNYGAGCSPDSLIGDDGVLEIKCQLAKGYVETLAYWNKHKRCPPGYIPQTQGQLLICDRDWVDLLFYHPDPKLWECRLTIRMGRDEAYIRALLQGIKAVLAERDELVEMLRAAA